MTIIRNITFILAILVILFPAIAESKDQIYFYDPDAGVNARSLRASMKTFLDKSGLKVNFQPFLEFSVMTRQMQKQKPVLVLAPSVHAQEFQEMSPLLIPDQQGRFTYTKAVVVPQEIQTLDDLMGKTIAATSPQFLQLLSQKADIPVDSMRFIPVKKDIDALLALQVSKQVDAAIVKVSGIEQFTKVNKEAAERLHVLFEFEVGYPIFWGYQDSEATVKEIVNALLNMHERPEGKDVLKLLKYDAWHLFTDEHQGQIFE